MSILEGSGRIVTDDLVLYLDAANTRSYPGTGITWSDLSRDGNNGTIINGSIFNSGNNGSIFFDGADDYCIVSPFSFLQNYTISVWIRPTSYILSNYHTFIARGGVLEANTNFSCSLRLRGVSLDWRLTSWWNGATSGIEWGIIDSPINVWNNFVITRNGSVSNAYKNAASLSILTQLNPTALPTDGSQPLTIAKSNTLIDTDVFYNGNIAQTLIYDRALSATEILQNYNVTKSRFGL